MDALVVPVDLGAALRANARARSEFEAGGASYRRNRLRWIELAKTGHTREKRIARIVESAARGERIPQI